MNFTIEEITEYKRRECPNCWVIFWIPASLSNRASNDPNVKYYCPNGHAAILPGKSLEERLKEATEQNDRLIQQRSEYLSRHDKQLRVLRGQITRLKNIKGKR